MPKEEKGDKQELTEEQKKLAQELAKQIKEHPDIAKGITESHKRDQQEKNKQPPPPHRL